MRLFVLIVGAGLIILTAMALVEYQPWKRDRNDERMEYSAGGFGYAEPAQPEQVVAAAPVPAPPPPVRAERPPAAAIDDRVAEDAAAVGMTTMEPDEEPSGAAATSSSHDEPIA